MKLTKRMVEILMDSHENEILHRDPFTAKTGKFITGLIVRKLLIAKQFYNSEGKPRIGFFITELGKQTLAGFLRHENFYSKKVKKLICGNSCQPLVISKFKTAKLK